MDDPTPRRDPREFFDAQVPEYARAHYAEGVRSFMSVRLERVLELVDGLALAPEAPALDAGCGPGHLVRALAERGLRVCALDASPRMLVRARSGLAEAAPGVAARARFARGSIEQLPLRAGHFELACSTGVIEYLAADAACLSELHRVLRPGGRLILSVTNRLSPVLLGDSVVEAIKRSASLRAAANALLRRTGAEPLRPRHFPVRRHRPAHFRRALTEAGFRVDDALFFHFLPWPRPLDRLLPRASARLGSRLEGLGRGRAGWLGEGYLVLATREP